MGGLDHLRDQPALAVGVIEAVFERARGLPPPDSLVLELHVFRAQARRRNGERATLIALLDDSLALLRRSYPPNHPQVLPARMRALEYAQPMQDGAQLSAHLQEQLSLASDVVNRFGPRSAPVARIQGNLGQLYLRLDDSAKAAQLFEQSWRGWLAAASPQHPNALRVLFNLAYVLGSSGAEPGAVDLLYQRLFEDASAGGDPKPPAFDYRKVSYAEFLVQRRGCALALPVLAEWFGAKLVENSSQPLRALIQTIADHGVLASVDGTRRP